MSLYIKQIFCRHSKWMGVRHSLLEQGFRLTFKTRMCVRCGRHKRA